MPLISVGSDQAILLKYIKTKLVFGHYFDLESPIRLEKRSFKDRVADDEKEVIPKSLQLVAGKTAQEINRRKERKSTFWEDRYHATAIVTGDHFVRCLVYIDVNMVRNGVVQHLSA